MKKLLLTIVLFISTISVAQVTVYPSSSNPNIKTFSDNFAYIDSTMYIQRVVSMTDTTFFTMTPTTADMNTQANTRAIGTLTANAPTGTGKNGQLLALRIKSTNVQTYSWNAIFRAGTTLALPTTSTGTSKTDYFLFRYNSSDTKWDLIDYKAGF